jgi:glycerol-3-phosphate dehydrogenase
MTMGTGTLVRDLDELERRAFDLVVIGGGITGACVAYDAAQRGLAVALVERRDFGGATSAASSKLIHSGIRYLQQAQVHKVRESARERAVFRRIAPHLVTDVPFLIPTYADLLKGRAFMQAGLWAYRIVCAGVERDLAAEARTPGDAFYSRAALLERHRELEGLDAVTGAWVIHELHLRSSERTTLAFLKAAAACGASAVNYVSAIGFHLEQGRVAGVDALDVESGRRLRIRTSMVVNAAGPWTPGVNQLAGARHLERPITAYSKGVHLVTRQVLAGAAVALPTRNLSKAVVTRGGRHLFVIPWRGCSLIGTTNVPHEGPPDTVAVTERDVTDFLAEINSAMPSAALTREDVAYAFAGLYPLTEPVVRPGVYQGTGEYQLVDHGRHGGPDGYLTALGAKYTTARRLAERAVNLVVGKLGARAECRTATTPLLHAFAGPVPAGTRELAGQSALAIDEAEAAHLASHYGTEAFALLDRAAADPGLAERAAPGRESRLVEVAHAVEWEAALHLADVVFRRTGIGTLGHPGRECLERCASVMARRLQWDDTRTDREIAEVEAAFHFAPPAGHRA